MKRQFATPRTSREHAKTFGVVNARVHLTRNCPPAHIPTPHRSRSHQTNPPWWVTSDRRQAHTERIRSDRVIISSEFRPFRAIRHPRSSILAPACGTGHPPPSILHARSIKKQPPLRPRYHFRIALYGRAIHRDAEKTVTNWPVPVTVQHDGTSSPPKANFR